MRWESVCLSAIAAVAFPAFAQGDPCSTESIQLNSGFHHTGGGGGSVYPIGAQDAWYRILYDPDPGTFEPRPRRRHPQAPRLGQPGPQHPVARRLPRLLRLHQRLLRLRGRGGT